jgi:hypothetical protein
MPGGHRERQRIRQGRNRCRSCKNSAGLIVPPVSPWKRGEREGALLQFMGLKGVSEVRLPYGEERSRQRPETAERPISHIQAGQSGEVLEPGRQGLEDGQPLGGLAASQSQQRSARSRWQGD